VSSPNDVIATWSADSSSGATKYEITLYRNGTFWCECGAWRFTKKGESRTCPHWRRLESEVAQILAEKEPRPAISVRQAAAAIVPVKLPKPTRKPLKKSTQESVEAWMRNLEVS
jgi:hypothetical protein